MSIQYQDGSFSETLPFNEIVERFNREMEEGAQIRALHFGSFQEVEAIKEKQAFEDRLDDLEQKIADLSPVKTFLEIPTREDIRNFANNRLQSTGQNDAPGE